MKSTKNGRNKSKGRAVFIVFAVAAWICLIFGALSFAFAVYYFVFKTDVILGVSLSGLPVIGELVGFYATRKMSAFIIFAVSIILFVAVHGVRGIIKEMRTSAALEERTVMSARLDARTEVESKFGDYLLDDGFFASQSSDGE